jgi:hypothetical protein
MMFETSCKDRPMLDRRTLAWRSAPARSPRAARGASGLPRPAAALGGGYPPGGASDTFARLIGGSWASGSARTWWWRTAPAAARWWRPRTVVRSPADGYHWLHVDNGILTYNPALYSRLPVNPDTDLAGVGFIGRFPLYIVVRPEGSPRDFADLLAASRTRAPTYGTPASPARTTWRWSWCAAAPGWRRPTCPIAAARPPCRTCSPATWTAW